MILDSFKPNNLIFQVEYNDRYEIWDRAGAMAREFLNEIPGLRLDSANPQIQKFVAQGINITIGLNKSTITLGGEQVFDSRNIALLSNLFGIWRKYLGFSVVSRISSRVVYQKIFDTIADANNYLISMGLVKWPTSKVFDQRDDSGQNGPQITYRFEDGSAFSVLRLKAEQLNIEVELDSNFFENPNLNRKINRVLLDFDRGVLGEVDAEKFRVDEWFKGFQHLLRRDIEKVVGGQR